MDPYQVLGLPNKASSEEIRHAYIRQAKLYHPDRFPEGPAREQATERFKAITMAYETLTGKRGGNQGDGTAAADFAKLSQAKKALQTNASPTAVAQLLDRISTRNGDWYYMYGVVNLRLSKRYEACRCFENALRMEPSNKEYRAAYDMVR